MGAVGKPGTWGALAPAVGDGGSHCPRGWMVSLFVVVTIEKAVLLLAEEVEVAHSAAACGREVQGKGSRGAAPFPFSTWGAFL